MREGGREGERGGRRAERDKEKDGRRQGETGRKTERGGQRGSKTERERGEENGREKRRADWERAGEGREGGQASLTSLKLSNIFSCKAHLSLHCEEPAMCGFLGRDVDLEVGVYLHCHSFQTCHNLNRQK